MRLHNSYTNQIEDFKTIDENKVKMYVCGPTVYDNAHLGHARCYITWDVLYRYLKFKGYDVTYCRNVTDVDDKILKKAEKEGKTPEEVSTFWYQRFSESMKALNNLKPDIEPFATKTLGEMISIVKDLINKGYAYEANGDVYFRVKKFPQYGYLSKQPIDQLESGARIEVGEQKEDPLDFALWKKDEKFGYKSPWGVGRPGWHIECSAMSRKYLGKTIDIHAGGADLIFPHHENEIAQSECANGCKFVNYWLHNGFVTINKEKMSKSLGNFFTVADILEHFEPETLRFFILSTHYRSPLDFSDERLKEAQRSLARLKTAQDNLKELAQLISGGPTETSKALYAKLEELRTGFMEAMSDDFNTALAISFMFELAKEINIYHQHISTGSEKPDGKLVENMEKLFAEFCGIIGVLETSAQPAAEKDASLEDKLIETVVSLRQEARAAKNYAQADALRNALTGLGIVLEDTPQGVRWKKQ